jgi:protein involved in polysaccharide export with SLBB domain
MIQVRQMNGSQHYRWSKSWLISFLALGISVFSLFGADEKSPARPTNSIPANGDTNYSSSTELIRPGDKLTVTLLDIPGLPVQQPVTVSEDGKITLHKNQVFETTGKTASQLQTEIRTRYVPSYYLEMTVNVKPEDRFFFVQGEVRQSDRYIYTGHTTVTRAISAAKGFTDFARKSAIEVIRSDGTVQKVDYDKATKNPKLDLIIYPGDIIKVPRRFF